LKARLTEAYTPGHAPTVGLCISCALQANMLTLLACSSIPWKHRQSPQTLRSTRGQHSLVYRCKGFPNTSTPRGRHCQDTRCDERWQ
jgi:hypothetical protein